jgi:hypothetical protein
MMCIKAGKKNCSNFCRINVEIKLRVLKRIV